MQTFVILLRGINVGGKNMLPMKELVPLLKANDYQDVSTYIQTGNIVLKATDSLKKTILEQDIKELITNHFGFTPNVFAITANEFNQVAADNPYKEKDGKLVHLYFCQKNIDLNLEKTHKWLAETEAYQAKANVFYLYAPEGIGRSKLVANIEGCLNQAGTGRNLNTVNKITVMIKG
jgi:uncharacterized protein (DUF1697 family)